MNQALEGGEGENDVESGDEGVGMEAAQESKTAGDADEIGDGGGYITMPSTLKHAPCISPCTLYITATMTSTRYNITIS